MREAVRKYDAVIIGGGFYGTSIAVYLARERGFKNIILVERESELLTRASYNNQARVHNGYHYPRSFTTANRSRINMPRFVEGWSAAIKKDFTQIYAISRRNSKVTSKQFVRFCGIIEARLEQAPPMLKNLFEPRLIEDVFLTEEYAFDASKLASLAISELKEFGVNIRLNAAVTGISNAHVGSEALSVLIKQGLDAEESIISSYVFNCTYSGLNQFKGDFKCVGSRLKHEVTEMALMKVPAELKGLGITVMDGSFFSMMPFPAKNLHTLSHVRYTPHLDWSDGMGYDPYQTLDKYNKVTRANRMVRDAGRYVPVLRNAKYVDSLFEVKTVLLNNEVDDGRPILFEKHTELPGCYSILGGKIDNIYDVFEKLDEEKWTV